MDTRAAAVCCGGCNPEIDRAGLIRSLVQKTGLVVRPAGQAGPEVQLLIAVNGWARGCLRKNGCPKLQRAPCRSGPVH